MWYPNFLPGSIISIIIEALLFLSGLFINTKIVLLEWKKRESKTWQIQIVCSICSTIYFAFDLPFSAISAAIPDLSNYTGDWFCNLATFIIIYGIFTFTTNSVVIAVMKYTFIVHPFKALEWGHAKIQKLFLVIYITIPSLMATIVIVTKDFESYKYIRMCFGMKKEDLETHIWKRLLLCNLKEIGIDESDNTHLQNSVYTICALRSGLAFLITSNIMEAFFYYKIFTKMKRYIYKFPTSIFF
jgi:hypothetical protein